MTASLLIKRLLVLLIFTLIFHLIIGDLYPTGMGVDLQKKGWISGTDLGCRSKKRQHKIETEKSYSRRGIHCKAQPDCRSCGALWCTLWIGRTELKNYPIPSSYMDKAAGDRNSNESVP